MKVILGPLLFNIFLIDLFFKIEDNYIASYVDGHKPCASSGKIDGVIRRFRNVEEIVQYQFNEK